MKYVLLSMVMLCAACASAPETGRTTTAVSSTVEPSVPPRADVPASIQPRTDGLSDLGVMTFRCPQAGLNAAAREAAKAPSQGRYQFAYYRLVNDSHHSSYEVHFKSNVQGEADLKYCVSVYCQQGQDPNAGVSVSAMSTAPRSTKARGAGAAHGADCGVEQTRASYGAKRSLAK